MSISDLTQEVKECAQRFGAHLVGVASVDRFEGAPKGHHPSDLLPGAKSVISFAIRFFQSTLECDKFGRDSELIPKEELWSVQQTIFDFMYATLNTQLQMIGVQLAHLLSSQGYKTLPLPAGGYKVGAGRYAFFSHRHAAALAGLGEIGLNNLLITPQYGPRVRLNSVITRAELTPDPMLEERVCKGAEECGLCLKAKTCFGDVETWNVGGKTMHVAKFMGCQKDLCKRSNPEGKLPFIRYCWGVCPVGKESG
jgi:epoxyqueuosine reductase QueG